MTVKAATAADRLREFEDAEIGPNAVRIGGRIERGFGSKFKGLPQDKQDRYAKLEKLVEAEQALNDAKADLATAQDEYDEALAAADAPDAGN